ncbi:MAG TPA: hypothetical protein DCE52_02305 [Rhodobacteraceae bacterium]|jgi:hypothetical protein|nr:hypothetical protein [Amylibacter sp.]HAB36832.1 hypothetical protein [Paracoccaceae bacterium]
MKRPLEVYERPHCAACGQLFTWEQVTKKREGRKLRFCSNNCVKIFDDYLLPTYGSDLLMTLSGSVFETP